MNIDDIEKVWLTDTAIWIRTKDGREAYEEFELLPRLKFATKEQREAYELNYFGIRWDEIDEVNIGAFPLRPKDEENRRLLDEFVAKLLTTRANALLTQGNIIPSERTPI